MISHGSGARVAPQPVSRAALYHAAMVTLETLGITRANLVSVRVGIDALGQVDATTDTEQLEAIKTALKSIIEGIHQCDYNLATVYTSVASQSLNHSARNFRVC